MQLQHQLRRAHCRSTLLELLRLMNAACPAGACKKLTAAHMATCMGGMLASIHMHVRCITGQQVWRRASAEAGTQV